MKEKILPYIHLTLAMFISGSAVVVNKMMINTIPTFLAAELGVLIGLIILFIETFVIKKEIYILDGKTLLVLFAQAIFGILLYRVFTFWGLMYTSAASSGLITSSSPAVVAMLACVLLKEKIRLRGFLGLLLVMIGLLSINFCSFFSTSIHQNSIMGNLLIMAAVLCEAIFSVLSKVKCRPMSPSFRTTMIVLFAFICLLPLSIQDAAHYSIIAMPAKTKICILYYGTFVSYLSYILWFKGIEKVKASRAALFTGVVPVSSILLAVIFLGEKILIIHIFGMILIVAGITLSNTRKTRFTHL